MTIADKVTRAAIAETYAVIREHIRRTPVLVAHARDFGLPGGELSLKLEFTQHSGSFKVRGAFANLLTRKVPAAGVAAASGGNHGAAVAYAAANGTFSHFNDNTDPVARTVQAVFAVGIMPLLLTTLVIAILLLIQRTGDLALTRALRAGLGLAVASMVVALWLSGSSGGSSRTVADANGHLVSSRFEVFVNSGNTPAGTVSTLIGPVTVDVPVDPDALAVSDDLGWAGLDASVTLHDAATNRDVPVDLHLSLFAVSGVTKQAGVFSRAAVAASP